MSQSLIQPGVVITDPRRVGERERGLEGGRDVEKRERGGEERGRGKKRGERKEREGERSMGDLGTVMCLGLRKSIKGWRDTPGPGRVGHFCKPPA